MKYIIITILTFALASCGGNEKGSVQGTIATQDLQKMKDLKGTLEAEKQALSAKIVTLEDEIKKLSPETKIPLVTSQVIVASEFIHYLELQGNVATKKNLVLYPEFSGILTNVYVKEGQRVSKGQRLGKISDGGLSQQLAQMQIQSNLAKTSYERQARLWEQKIGTEMQYLQAKSNYESQQQAVNQIQEQIAKTIIKAPFSGTIDDVITEQGSVVSPGQTALFRVVSLSDMYIETDVPEKYIADITKNDLVQVEFPILGKTVETKVRQAGNFINPANRTFKVEITVPSKDKSIKPNLTARVKINDYTNKNAILIPQSIVSENAEGKQYVYKIIDKSKKEATAKRILITTGRTQGDLIEVLSGLAAGDEIVVEGARSVKEGQKVKFN